MKNSRKKLAGMVLSLLVALNAAGTFSVGASALEDAQQPKKETGSTEKSGAATRTIMLFMVGSNLESDYGCATDDLIECMEAEYDENVNIIAVTGGSPEWHTEAEYLDGAEAIDPMLNQIWKVEGKKDGEEHGKMTLLEPGGLPGFEDALISQPAALTGFIDYCYDNYKTDYYDIVFWNHGGGPAGAFGYDDRFNVSDTYLDTADLIKGLSGTQLISDGQKFEILDFDACLMSSVEIVTALYDYADNLVLSSNLENGTGQYYTPVLEALREAPSMSGFELGKHFADNFVNFDEENYGSYATTTLAVINTDNYKKRLAGKLERFDDILISEAKNPGNNGELNFYDELQSLGSIIEFDDESLFDLGGLAGAFSTPNAESTNTTNEDYIARQNAYTEIAKEILTVLNDQDGSGDDVIYSRHSADYVRKFSDYNYSLRGLDGDFLETDGNSYVSVSPTGLSLYFGRTYGTPELSYTANYLYFMNAAINAAENPDVKTRIQKRLNAVAYYKLISVIGCAVSTLKSEGVETIDLETVKAYLNTQDEGWDYDVKTMLKYLEHTGEFDGEEEGYAYVSELIAQQQKDHPAPDDITCKKVMMEGELSYYYVNFKNCFAKAFNALSSSLNMLLDDTYEKDPDLKQELQTIVDDFYEEHVELDKLFPNGLWVNLCTEEGMADLSSGATEFNKNSLLKYKNFYANDSYICILIEQDPVAMTLADNTGRQHIINPSYYDDTHTTGFVPIIIKVNGKYKRGTLEFASGKAGNKPEICSLCIYDDKELRYFISDFTSDEWEGASFAPISFETDYYGYEIPIPLSSFINIDNTKEFWGLSFGTADYTKITNNHVESDYHFQDIYGADHDMKDLIDKADEDAGLGNVEYFIEEADVTVGDAVYDGNEQRPEVTVTYDGKVLTEGVDYKVLYDGSIAPGNAKLQVVGLGDYFSIITVDYTITCPHFFEVKNTTPATCIEKGFAEYECPVCGETKTEELEPLGHDWGEWVVTKEPTETEQGEKKRICSRCGEEETEVLPVIEAVKTNISDTRIYISDYKQPYTGDTVKPKVVVFYRGKRLVEGKDYELSYENAVDPGKAAVNITGIGKFCGTVTGKYYVTPAKVELNNVTSDTKGTLDISWTNDGTADGYEILLYSSKSRGFTNTITRFKANGDESSMKIANLRAGSRCTVFIRAYKNIDGKPVYSKFTASHSVTIKGYNFGFNWDYIFGWSLFHRSPFGWF